MSARPRPGDGAMARGPALVTGVGLVSSIGLSAAAACAALRAGTARPAPLQGLSVLDPDTQEPVAVTGHPIAGYTDGFLRNGRWLRLARGALQDLLGSRPAAGDLLRARAALLLATPLPDADVFQCEPGEEEERLRRPCLAGLREVLPLLADGPVEFWSRGHTSVAAALGRAAALLGQGLDRVLVVAADSWLHPVLLRRLLEEGRLKCDDCPSGLMPGEAGAAFLLESPHAARAHGARPLAELRAAGTRACDAGTDDPVGVGRQLAGVVRAALAFDGPEAPFDGELVSDLNGETWRAAEWGTVRVLLGSALAERRLHLPAASLGDTGAASGGVGLALALHLLSRVRPSARALVLSRAEHGEVGAVALRAPKGVP